MMDRKADWIGLCIKQALEEDERARSSARIVGMLAIAMVVIAACLTVRLSQPPVSFAPSPTFQMGGSARE